MTLVIMAAGLGSRFGGLKQLTPLTDDGEIILDFSVYDAVRAGFDKIIFIIRPEHEKDFEEKIGAKMRKAGVNIEYRFQKLELPAGYTIPQARLEKNKPFGTGHAILSAGKINEPFAVINADDFYGAESFRKLAGFLGSTKNNDWCMVAYKVKNTLSPNGTVSRGICKSDADGKLVNITEYLKIERKDDKIFNIFPDGSVEYLDENQNVSMTCFGFTPGFCDGLGKLFGEFLEENKDNLEKCEFYLPTAVQKMLEAGKGTMTVLDTDSEWKGVTYKEDSGAFREFIRALKAKGEYPKKIW